MELIGREELKAKLDRRDKFHLVMALGEWAYRAKHIPGSIYFTNTEEAMKAAKGLTLDEEIVVYCSNPGCMASITAYNRLKGMGFRRVRRFAGGVEEWEAAGFPLEGEDVAALRLT